MSTKLRVCCQFNSHNDAMLSIWPAESFYSDLLIAGVSWRFYRAFSRCGFGPIPSVAKRHALWYLFIYLFIFEIRQIVQEVQNKLQS